MTQHNHNVAIGLQKILNSPNFIVKLPSLIFKFTSLSKLTPIRLFQNDISTIIRQHLTRIAKFTKNDYKLELSSYIKFGPPDSMNPK